MAKLKIIYSDYHKNADKKLQNWINPKNEEGLEIDIIQFRGVISDNQDTLTYILYNESKIDLAKEILP
jgi:hypothetical protein